MSVFVDVPLPTRREELNLKSVHPAGVSINITQPPAGQGMEQIQVPHSASTAAAVWRQLPSAASSSDSSTTHQGHLQHIRISIPDTSGAPAGTNTSASRIANEDRQLVEPSWHHFTTPMLTRPVHIKNRRRDQQFSTVFDFSAAAHNSSSFLAGTNLVNAFGPPDDRNKNRRGGKVNKVDHLPASTNYPSQPDFWQPKISWVNVRLMSDSKSGSNSNEPIQSKRCDEYQANTIDRSRRSIRTCSVMPLPFHYNQL